MKLKQIFSIVYQNKQIFSIKIIVLNLFVRRKKLNIIKMNLSIVLVAY